MDLGLADKVAVVTGASNGPVGAERWLGQHGVAETVAEATGVDADTARETIVAGIGGFAAAGRAL